MPHGNSVTPLEQRVVIWELAQRGQSDPAIAQQLGLSPSVVRKWRRRAQRQGRAGLGSHLGRPARGALSHWSPEVRESVRQMRRDHPGWGPLTLRTELARRPQPPQPLPSRARIAAFLKQEGLPRPYERHEYLAQPARGPEPAAHAEWQMDAQGVQVVAGVGRVVLINVGDPYTRLLTDSLGCRHTAVPSTDDYLLALRRAFLSFGRPYGLSLDHDRCFYDSTTASPYPTRLHLWLLALDVAVRFIGVRQPTQHGFIEHEHQIVTHQALDGQTFEPADALQPALDERRAFLNAAYPNRALGGQAPLQADPAAGHSGRAYAPEREAELLDPQRVYAYLAQHRWFRRTTDRGQFELGSYRYGLGVAWGQQTVQLTFDPQTLELLCQSEDGQQVRRLPAQGLTPADWMGQLQPERLPTYQLAFPWSLPACRLGLLCEAQAGTTL
jgi:transposase